MFRDISVSVDGRSLLQRLSVCLGIGLVDCRADALEHEIELVVCGVQIVQDPRGKAEASTSSRMVKEEPMRDIDEE